MNLSHNLSLLTKSIGSRLGYDDSHSNLGTEFNALKSDTKAFRAEIDRIATAAQELETSYLRYREKRKALVQQLIDGSSSSQYESISGSPAESLGADFLALFTELENATMGHKDDQLSGEALLCAVKPKLSSLRRKLEYARETKQTFYTALHERQVRTDEMQAMAHSKTRAGATKQFYTAQQAFEKADRNYHYHFTKATDEMKDALRSRDQFIVDVLVEMVNSHCRAAVQSTEAINDREECMAAAIAVSSQGRNAAANKDLALGPHRGTGSGRSMMSSFDDSRRGSNFASFDSGSFFGGTGALRRSESGYEVRQPLPSDVPAILADAMTMSRGYAFSDLVLGLSPPIDPPLYKGEGIVLRVENVLRLGCKQQSGFSIVPGHIVVTSYRLIFASYRGGGEDGQEVEKESTASSALSVFEGIGSERQRASDLRSTGSGMEKLRDLACASAQVPLLMISRIEALEGEARAGDEGGVGGAVGGAGSTVGYNGVGDAAAAAAAEAAAVAASTNSSSSGGGSKLRKRRSGSVWDRIKEATSPRSSLRLTSRRGSAASAGGVVDSMASSLSQMALGSSPSASGSFKFRRSSIAKSTGTGANTTVADGGAPAFEDTKTVCACWTEDLQCFSFALRYSSTTVEQLMSTMKSFAWSAQNNFALYYQPSIKTMDEGDGWTIYEPVREFMRMGVLSNAAPGKRRQAWRISTANRDYELCPTYPATLIVPERFTDEGLAVAAGFRSKRRLPVLSWHGCISGEIIDEMRSSRGERGIAGSHGRSIAILRSAQPLTATFKSFMGEGVSGQGDTGLLAAAATANLAWSNNQTDEERIVRIFDARPYVNAAANTAKGGGYESGSRYTSFCTIEFLNIANIHAARKAFVNLHGVIASSGLSLQVDESRRKSMMRIEGALQGIEVDGIARSCEWLKLIAAILAGARRIVESTLGLVKSSDLTSMTTRSQNGFRTGSLGRSWEACTALIHCSDGWDRTAQLTSLVEMMLDPFYRTIRGFEVIIEKEWCSFGHKFADRYGHCGDIPGAGSGTKTVSDRSNWRDQERSPIFVQFLDCIWQMMKQHPERFEFNELLLEVTHHHLYSCRYGTFLGNCEGERHKGGLLKRSQSLWTDVNRDLEKFRNPTYVDRGVGVTSATDLLLPAVESTRLRLWPCHTRRWLGVHTPRIGEKKGRITARMRSTMAGGQHGTIDEGDETSEEADDDFTSGYESSSVGAITRRRSSSGVGYDSASSKVPQVAGDATTNPPSIPSRTIPGRPMPIPGRPVLPTRPGRTGEASTAMKEAPPRLRVSIDKGLKKMKGPPAIPSRARIPGVGVSVGASVGGDVNGSRGGEGGFSLPPSKVKAPAGLRAIMMKRAGSGMMMKRTGSEYSTGSAGSFGSARSNTSTRSTGSAVSSTASAVSVVSGPGPVLPLPPPPPQREKNKNSNSAASRQPPPLVQRSRVESAVAKIGGAAAAAAAGLPPPPARPAKLPPRPAPYTRDESLTAAAAVPKPRAMPPPLPKRN